MTIAIYGQVTPEDIALARSLHRKGGLMWKTIAILVALIAGYAYWGTIMHGGNAEEGKTAWGLVSVALGVLGFAFLSPWIWRPAEAPGSEVARTATDNGIDFQDGVEPRFISWEQIARTRTSDRIAIVYTRSRRSPGCIFPRRLFGSQEDWCQFVELLRTKVAAL